MEVKRVQQLFDEWKEIQFNKDRLHLPGHVFNAGYEAGKKDYQRIVKCEKCGKGFDFNDLNYPIGGIYECQNCWDINHGI